MASTVASPPPARAASSKSNVSYEMFAPRSTAQVSRLSRIAALTAGPTARASTETRTDDSGGDTLLKAMSPPPAAAIAYTMGEHVTVHDDVQETLATTIENSDQLTHLLKHTTSLRLALRASINIAEDISNRHAELIRHSSELSAAADRLQDEQAMLTHHAEEIGMPLKHYDAVDNMGVLWSSFQGQNGGSRFGQT